MFHNWRQRQNLTRKRTAAQQEKARRRAKEQRCLTLEALEDRQLMTITGIALPVSQQKNGRAPLGFFRQQRSCL